MLISWFDANSSLLLLGTLWLLYFSIHSLLANNQIKSQLVAWSLVPERYYRLLYNSIAVLTLMPVVFVMLRQQGADVIQWQGEWGLIALALNLIAAACFFWSLKYYDMSLFLGWKRPIASHSFVVSPLHRFVRHPWYSCGLVILWCRDMDEAQLLSSLFISAYLLVGSKFEEARLVDEFGKTYKSYMDKVPGLIPLPWKFLTKHQIDEFSSKN